MNCFAHGFRFLDDPYLMVGTAIPDWLSMIDRKVRVRERNASELVGAADEATRKLAQGIVHHHQDDFWFHDNRQFVQLNLELSLELRALLGADAGFRPHFVAHVLIEVLLDASLASRDTNKLDAYYDSVSKVDSSVVQKVVNEIAAKSTDRLTQFFPKFIHEAYLYDYFEDDRVMYRMNRILNRVKLSQLPESIVNWIPSVRQRVYAQSDMLLARVLTP